ncbi:MAG TPA: hypothetical protein DCE47_18800 [Planctomycetaceae bacterium]|nr:hypothetical protein [Planctomycetaceae bacterium]|tara:strand:- start:1656 stop:2015 length:360 start_codon:yes stop_codon:yes gene_type:complete
MGGDHRLGQQRKQLDALLDLASVLDEWLKRRAAKNLPRLESFQFFNSIRFWPVAAAIGRAACRLSEEYRSGRLLQEITPVHFIFFDLFHGPAWWRRTGGARTGRSGFPGSHRHDDKAAG